MTAAIARPEALCAHVFKRFTLLPFQNQSATRENQALGNIPEAALFAEADAFSQRHLRQCFLAQAGQHLPHRICNLETL
jgi:hypothetical protein